MNTLLVYFARKGTTTRSNLTEWRVGTFHANREFGYIIAYVFHLMRFSHTECTLDHIYARDLRFFLHSLLSVVLLGVGNIIQKRTL